MLLHYPQLIQIRTSTFPSPTKIKLFYVFMQAADLLNKLTTFFCFNHRVFTLNARVVAVYRLLKNQPPPMPQLFPACRYKALPRLPVPGSE